MLRRVSSARLGLRLPPCLYASEDLHHNPACKHLTSSGNRPKDIENLKIMHGFVDTSTTFSDLQQGLFWASPRTLNSFQLGFKVKRTHRIPQSSVLLQKRGVDPMQCRHIHYSMGITKPKALPLCIIALTSRKPYNVSGSYGSFLIFDRPHMGLSHDDHEHKYHEGTGNAGERVSRLGLIADIGLTIVKALAGYASGSTAVIADAAHSMSDMVLSAVALWSFKAARAPKDQMHPYGHGKFETVGALGIASMLLLTGGGIAWHALEVIQMIQVVQV